MNVAGFPATGVAGIVYEAADTGIQYLYYSNKYVSGWPFTPTVNTPSVFCGTKS